MARGELKGVVCLYRLGQNGAFTREELTAAARFAELAALAIDNTDIRSKLESLAMTDYMTGLHNHRYFQERLQEEVSRANHNGTPVSLLLYDIDDFKKVNDSYGHLLGDQVLVAVATAARGVCRSEDPVCRIGGEEFGVILPGQAGTHARLVADRIRRSVLELSLPMETHVTVSVGLAEAPTSASNPRDLFACADLALRSAKSQGKNRVCAYAGSALEPRLDFSGDHPLSGQWEILAHGETKRRREGDTDHPQQGVHDISHSRWTAQMKMLHSVSASLSQVHDTVRIAETIAHELRSLIGYEGCRVHLLGEDGETLADTMLVAGESSLRQEATEGPGRAGEAPPLIESLLAAPLRFDDQPLGVIVLSKRGVEGFDEDDARLLEVLAAMAAVALHNARMVEVSDAAALTLENAYLSTVQALANALEAQDEYTSDHARAIAEMSLLVGSELGMGEADLHSLELAALFHDIGKIGVRSEIIRKPGQLTAEEWQEMERHPEIGERILAPVAFLQSIRPVVRSCHERWDGRGYPDGVAGEQIPFHARVVFVCDAFHAMSTRRPYREALPEEEAVQRIVKASGSQFDPGVVDAFCRLYERGSLGSRPHHFTESTSSTDLQ
jgi:diguanylate cyclase (GGDEF)-like protein